MAADGEDDGTGDQRREELADVLEEDAEEDGNHAAHQLGAKQRAKAELEADGLEGRQEGKGDARQDGQVGADAPEERELLEERVQGRQDEGHLDDGGLLGLGEVAGAGDHHRRGYGSGKACQDVLQGARQEVLQRGNALALEQQRGLRLLLLDSGLG